MIKILADSGCDFSSALKDNPQVKRIPLTLTIGGEVFIDDLTINMSQLIDALKLNHKNRQTAAPSPQLFYDECKCDEPVFIVTLSSHLSGSYNSAVTAARMCAEELGKENIFVVDSHSAAAGETYLAELLLEYDKQGLSFEEICSRITADRDNMQTYFILKNYDTFVDNGRLNPYVAKVAQMLNIVPICAGDNGVPYLAGQARGDKAAYKKLISLIKKSEVDTSARHISLTHIMCKERAQAIITALTSALPFASSEITENCTGLCAVYADLDGIIIAF
jgi:DegV family protein with EDD domain